MIKETIGEWSVGIVLSGMIVLISVLLDLPTMLLVYAVRKKYPKIASFALRTLGANPNVVVSGENSILTIAILVFASFETDLVFLLSELLRAGADPSYQDSQGLTALHYACRFLVPSSAVRLLLKRSPHILNITTNEFETAFHYAIDHHHQWENCLDLVRVLLKYGANPNKTSGLQQTPPLVQACRNRVVPVVELLLKQNVDVNATDINKRGALIATLHSVLPGDITTLVKCLLKCNADTLMKDNENMTALMYAARRKRTMFLVGPLILSESLKRALQLHNRHVPKLESKESASRFPCCPDFSWLCMDTEDKFVQLVESILESDETIRRSAREFVSSSKHVRIQHFERSPNLVTRVLSELVDRSGRRIIDAATPKIRDCLHKRLLFLGRYELSDGPPTHSSNTSTVILALDRQPHVLYEDVFRALCSQHSRMDRIAFSVAASVVGLNRIVSKSKYEAIEASAFSTSTSSLSLNDFVGICAEHMDRGGKVRKVALKFLRDSESFFRECHALFYAKKNGIIDARNFRTLSKKEIYRRVKTLRNVLPILDAISEKESSVSFKNNVQDLENHFRWRLGDENLVIGKNLLVLDAASRNLEVVQLMEDLSVETIRFLLAQVLKTLARLHLANICHGDVKPGNIVRVHTSGRTCWRLIDYDCAYQIGDIVNIRDKKISLAFTPCEYAQCLTSKCKDDKHVFTMTSKFDTWSFGAVSFELLAGGRPLFRSDGTSNVLADVKEMFRLCSWIGLEPSLQNQIASSLSNRDSDFTLTAQHFVASCLSCDPRLRPSCRDLLFHPFFDTKRVSMSYRTISRDQFVDDDIEEEEEECEKTRNIYSDISESDLVVPRKCHCFISYAQNDASGMATSLYFAFRRCGLSVWLDNFEMDVTSEGMKRGVSSCEFFLVCLTSNYLTRPWCLKELKWAVEMNKRIVFVREVDRRFSPWHYQCWRAGRKYDRDSSDYVKYEEKHEKYIYEKFKPLRVRDVIDASAQIRLDAGKSDIASAQSTIGMMPFRRKQWAFDAMVDELLRRVGIRVPSISCLYQKTTVSTMKSMCDWSHTPQHVVTPDTPKTLYVVSTTDALGSSISKRLVKSIVQLSNGNTNVLALSDAIPFPDTFLDEHFIIVLSKGILKAQIFSRILHLPKQNLSFIYATRNDETTHDETDWEWKFNGREIKNSSREIQVLLQSYEALPFRWLNEDRGLEYEHYAMIRELLKRITALRSTSRLSFG